MTTRSWSTKRSTSAVVAAFALAVGACSSNNDDPAETGIAPETTTSTTTTTTPEAAAADGDVTPTVACVDTQHLVAYFGYTNSGDAAVEIPVGDDNHVAAGTIDGLTIGQPAVFAPGEQSVVFWVPDESDDPVTWSVTSGDGTERTATADDAAPECEDGVPPLDPPDDREPELAVEVDDSGDVPIITITVEGLDESRCPSGDGWTPEAPEITLDAGGLNATVTDGETPGVVELVVLVVDDAAADPIQGFDAIGFASVHVNVDVDDHCTDASGATSEAWASGPAFLPLSQQGTYVCFAAGEDGYGETPCSDGPQLAPTGGIRNR